MCVQRLAVHGVGDDHLAGVESGIDFGQGKDSTLVVGAGGDEVCGQGIPA